LAETAAAREAWLAMTEPLLYQFEPTLWSKGIGALAIAVLLSLVAIGSAVWFTREARARQRVIVRLVWSFALAVVALLTAVGATEHLWTARSVLNPGQWQTVCGRIADFTTRDKPNTGQESFVIGGVLFEYADYGPPGVGYRTTQSRGGIFHPGMRTRVHYTRVRRWNVIMRATRVPDEVVGSCE